MEHDLTLVRDLRDYVYVLDFGSLIFEGTPEEMHGSDQVRASYLGDAAAAVRAAAEGSPSDGGPEPLVSSE
jgi:ABC-type transporter Mla maintaining outer membrane lipid asymmetry ATPase subunit MlaF